MRSVVAVLGVVAACGDGVGAPDAMPPPDSNIGLVRVRYLGEVTSQRPVYFQNADGSVVLATRTDGDGTANAYMAPGGYVTLVDPLGGTLHIYTWADVQPGDELAVTGVFPDTTRTTTLVVSLPIDPGAVVYQLQSSCGQRSVAPAAGSSLVIELGDCRGRADMFLYTIGAGLHYIYAEDVPAKTGSVVTFPAPYRVMGRSAIAVQNVPAGTTSLRITQRLVGEGASLFDPDQIGLFGVGTLPVVDGAGALDIDMLLPPEATALTQMALDDEGASRQFFARWERTTATTSVDLAGKLLRRYLTRPQYDPSTHAISWTEEPAGRVANAVLASWTFTRPEIGGNFQWHVFAPRGDEPVVKLPVLPDPELLPRAGDVISPPYSLINIGVEGGFGSIRSTHLGNFNADDSWPTTGASGDVVYQELGFEPF